MSRKEHIAPMSLFQCCQNAKLPTSRNAFFCESGKEEDILYEISTFDSVHNIRTMINELGDTKSMPKIVGGDLMASESEYHLPCQTKLRNRYRSFNRKLNPGPVQTDEKMNESRAFVELTNYIKKK